MNTRMLIYLFRHYVFLPLILVFGAITIIASGGGGGDGAPTSYSITGTVSGGVAENVTITLSGAASSVTTTDNSGNYSFSGLDNGNYTLTPSLANYTFTPASISLSINNAGSSGNNFTSIGSLAGTVSGDTAGGVRIDLTGPITPTSTITNAGGYYIFEGLPNKSYTITPFAASYSFNPVSTTLNFSGVASTNNDFIATATTTYSISGSVSGDIKANVPINLTGNNTGTTFTDINGVYVFNGLASGTYTVTPDRTDYTFNPLSTPPIILTANVTNQNFVGTSSVSDWPRYSVSGTVTNSSSVSTGVIYILLQEPSGAWSEIYGTSIDTSGAYTIRGVAAPNDPQPYQAVAYLDSLDNGAPNASDPYAIPVDFSITGADRTGVDLNLTDPTLPAPVAPGIIIAIPYDQGAAVLWETPFTARSDDDLEYEIATFYDLYWDTSPSVGPSNNIGSVILPAMGDEMGHYFVNNLSNGQSLYFAVRARNSAGISTVTPTSSSITISDTTGGSTVSGSVSFSAASGHALYVVLYDFESAVPNVYATRIDNASSPQAYSLSGVTNGNYYMLASLDVNDNNIMDLGDLEYSSEWRFESITVNNSNVVRDLNLNSDASRLRVRTENRFEYTPPAPITHTGYSVLPELEYGTKRVKRFTIEDAHNLNTPIDINSHEGIGRFESNFTGPKPYVNDPYTYEVTYTDNLTDTLVDRVKALLESYATPTYPVGTSADTHPTFTWNAPASPPSVYFYNLAVYSNVPGATAPWSYWDLLPSSTTSLEYNVDGEAVLDPLPTSYFYWWHLNVIDQNENRISVRTQFEP